MTLFILGLLLGMLALVFWVLYKTYEHVPAREIKRMARSGDEVAALLYKPVAYGLSLRLLLGLLIILCAAGALNLFVVSLGAWLATVLVVVMAVVGGTIFVPTGELTHSSLWLAKHAAPGIAWLLERLHPVFDFFSRLVRRHHPVPAHTKLYEKADLAELLEKQKSQPDNRIAVEEIDLLKHSLTFGDWLVSDASVPKRVVKLVSAGESIGPILMADLHKSGYSRFPVYDGKPDNLVGILYLHDLVAARQIGKVSDVMKPKLTYVHEDFTLYRTLQAFLKTKQHLFLVVNSFEEFVGIITIEDVLEQMIGKPIVDEFDSYDDLRAVAAAAAKKDHAEHQATKAEPEATVEAPEVVE
jgi:CBS domain containing-hemolysin-like protein